jgi:cytochrome c oxidase subunit 2
MMTMTKALDCVACLGAAFLVYEGISVRSTPVRAHAQPRVIEVLARKFSFEPSRIEVTHGEKVRMVVRSADGVHGFRIKKFRIAEEVPRGGEPVMIEFTASAVGEFEILCSEYCGRGHDEMSGTLIVLRRSR